MRGRRRVLQLALGAAGCMGVVSLYQMGVIRHLLAAGFTFAALGAALPEARAALAAVRSG